MTVVLRIILVIASLINCFWIIHRICKSQARIEDSIFWICLSALLILMSVFPQVVICGAKITGVQSPVNFVFLCMIFILLVKDFRMSLKISALEARLQQLAQRYGIDTYLEKTGEKKENQADENGTRS